MNAYQKVKGFFFGGVKGRFLVGRRLVLDFPASKDAKVSMVALPDWRATHFSVEPSATEATAHALVLSGPEGQRFELAEFANRADAVAALGQVRRKFTRPYLTVIKWLVILVLVIAVGEWAVRGPLGRVLGGNRLAAPPVAQMGMGGLAGSGAPSMDQIKALQAMKAGGVGSPTAPAGAGGLPTPAGANGSLTAEQIQQVIKQRYGIDVNSVPGAKEAVEQALQNAPIAGTPTTSASGVPVAPQTTGDVKAAINLLESSK